LIYPDSSPASSGMAVDERANSWPGCRPAWAFVRCHGLCPGGSTCEFEIANGATLKRGVLRIAPGLIKPGAILVLDNIIIYVYISSRMKSCGPKQSSWSNDEK
jgi:hypothetical protein